MKLAVVGATGGIGTEVTRQALAAGLEVVAPVRRPERMTVTGRGLSVEPADVLDPEQLVPAIKEVDAVVSALGPRRGDRPDVLTRGARALIPSMLAVGVSRLVVVSADGAFPGSGDGFLARHLLKPVVGRLFLRDAFADARSMEEAVRASDLDWTIIRPPWLTDGPFTGRYRSAVDSGLPRGYRIARADVAHAILTALPTTGTVRHAITVAH
jgi:putative NADH-flavin reductase